MYHGLCDPKKNVGLLLLGGARLLQLAKQGDANKTTVDPEPARIIRGKGLDDGSECGQAYIHGIFKKGVD